MNTPIEISSLAEYINQIDEITHPEKSYLYRGQENEVWRMTSSAYRRLVSSSENLGQEADLPPYSLRHLYQIMPRHIIIVAWYGRRSNSGKKRG